MKKLILVAFIFVVNIAIAQSGEVYFNEAYEKSDKGDLLGAVEAYTKCISLEPNSAEAYFNRGHVKYDLKDYKGAIEDVSFAIELKPTIAAAGYSDIGLYYFMLHDYTVAIDFCTKSIEINPQQAEAYTNRALSKRMLKQPFCDDLKIAKDLGDVNAIKYYPLECN
jgi:tetratricopeptide (TPR) repeat protein